MARIGLGVLGWDRDERVSNRYGSVYLGRDAYPDRGVCPYFEVDREALARLEGQRVRLWAYVLEVRQSGHIGDLFLGVSPSTPEVASEHVLGVGVLRVGKGYDGSSRVVLEPLDGRPELWMDPRVLYRLHDQTVELFAEVTDEPGSVVEPFEEAEPDGMLSTGEVEPGGVAASGSEVMAQTFQTKGVPLPERACPEPERLGEGLFALDFSPKRGKRWGPS